MFYNLSTLQSTFPWVHSHTSMFSKGKPLEIFSNVGSTKPSPPGMGDFSAATAFMLGLGLGIGALLVIGILVIVWFCQMKRREGRYRLVSISGCSEM